MRLIDADALKYTMLYKENWLRGTGVEAPAVWKSDVDEMPAIDAVPVVRCRECIHRKKYQDDEQQGDTICPLDWNIRKLEWFCADGQRREDGDE